MTQNHPTGTSLLHESGQSNCESDMKMNELIEHIQHSASRILSHPTFCKWAEPITWQEGDLLLVNNSFVFRDVDTTKAPLYLAYTADGAGNFTNLRVATPSSFNADFKRIPSKGAESVPAIPLSEAVREQHNKLGKLVYLLVSQIDDSIVQSVPIDAGPFQRVTWDPKLSMPCQIQGTSILVRETFDEDGLWQVVLGHVAEDVDINDLKQKFGHALDQLQDMAMAHLQLPQPGAALQGGVTSAICEILKQERSAYAEAVASLPNPAALNEVLRIAYNFAGDATNYIRLIVSICDLKPLILWGAIAEHFDLSERFRQLPWTRRNRKPSLKNYESTIKDARNSAFHNLFPFRKSLSVHLPTGALEDAELRIFSEHSKKKENTLNYIDKPLVDVLVGFTRARETRVADRFWEKNVEVMDSTIALFEATDALLFKAHLA